MSFSYTSTELESNNRLVKVQVFELRKRNLLEYFESYEMPENSTGIHHSQPLYPDRGTGVCTRVPADSTYDSTH